MRFVLAAHCAKFDPCECRQQNQEHEKLQGIVSGFVTQSAYANTSFPLSFRLSFCHVFLRGFESPNSQMELCNGQAENAPTDWSATLYASCGPPMMPATHIDQ